MLIDHLGTTLFPQAVWMRCVGRLAFPLFAFLIAEGFCRTRSFQRYLLRLLLCAALSEVPFNLLRSGRPVDPAHQNVLWTFCIALAVLWCMEQARQMPGRTARYAVCAASVLAGWMLGMYLRTDYGGWGVVTVILLALCRGRDGGWLAMLAGLVCINGVCLAGQVIHLGPLGFPMQLLAALAIVPISLYDGRRGPGGRGVQLAFYAFYPVHMLVLALLAQFLS